jgi:CubicO group peptidase (beta-lactamase class C family)
LNESLLRYYMNETIPPIGECKNITLLKTPLLFDPGDRWEYGISLDWAGKAIEAASGQPFNDYLWDNILAPLGMNDTAFIIKPAMRSRLAAVHVRNADGSLVRIEFEMPQEPEFCMGGSGLYSTAGDYRTFLQMILHGGTLNGVGILQPETVQKMGRNQIGDLNVPPLKSAIPALANDLEFFPGMVKKWGLGFMLTTEDAPTGRSAWSMSWCGIANTYFWVDPVKQVIGGALTQVLPGADARAEDLFARFETSVYQQL